MNENPVGDQAPGTLLCLGPRELRSRRPGWNLFPDRDGGWYSQLDRGGDPPYPTAHFPPEAVAAATVVADSPVEEGDPEPAAVGCR